MGALGLWAVLGALQNPTVEGILRDFAERVELSRSDAETRAAAEKALAELDALPKAADAQFHGAEMLVCLGRLDEAIDRFLAFCREYPDDPNRATALFSAAALFEEQEKFADARSRYDEFAQKHGDDPRASTARIRSAMGWLYGGDATTALAALRKLADQEAETAWEARLALALALHLAEKKDEAAKVLTDVAQKNPDRAVGRLIDDFRRVGKAAPDLVVGDFKLAERKGKVVLLYLFSATGEGAAAEVAGLKRVHEAFKERGFEVAGVCVDSLPESLERYRADFAPPWPLVHDARGAASRAAFGAAEAPYAVLCDRKGVVRFLHLAGRDLAWAVRRLVEEK